MIIWQEPEMLLISSSIIKTNPSISNLKKIHLTKPSIHSLPQINLLNQHKHLKPKIQAIKPLNNLYLHKITKNMLFKLINLVYLIKKQSTIKAD